MARNSTKIVTPGAPLKGGGILWCQSGTDSLVISFYFPELRIVPPPHTHRGDVSRKRVGSTIVYE